MNSNENTENNYKLVIYSIASKDIENICQYLSVDLSNPVAASDFIDELYDSFKTLLCFPKMYPLVDNQFITDGSIRKMAVKHYLVFYKLQDTEIQVIRILHGRTNYISLLN